MPSRLDNHQALGNGRSMSHWPLTPEDITRPAYRSLAQGIANAIEAGALRSGDRLPPHRDLAWQLGLSVQTVSRAYEELIRADLVTGEVGRGSFVKARLRETMTTPWHKSTRIQPKYDLSLMTPVALAQINEAWSETLHRIAGRLDETVIYGFRPRQTASRYANMAAAWLGRCGLVVGTGRILVTNGMTPAMHVALATVASPGDVIATETLTSHTLRPTAKSLQLQLRGIACDDRGMCPDALVEAAKDAGGQMKAVFLLPSGAGPCARIVDADRRAALADAAVSQGLAILECDPLGPLAARRPPPIATLAPHHTFYFTGMTKCLSPGLRIGMLAIPEARVESAVSHHMSAAWMVTPLMAEIAKDWIETGTIDHLLAAQRSELVARNRLAESILGTKSLGARHGLHRWVMLPEGMDEATFQRDVLAQGVALAAGSGFFVSNPRPAIRLCLGGVARRDLEAALTIVSRLLPRQGGVQMPSG